MTLATSNLDRARARARAELLRVQAYDVALDVAAAADPSQETFASTTTITFAAARPGASSFVDLVAQRIRSARLNGRPLDVSEYRPATGLPLTDLAETNTLVIEADLPYTNTGEGLHRFVDPLDGQTYLHSHFEVGDAQRMFACFDQPDLKAPFTLRATVPAHWQAAANGRVHSVEATGPSKVVHFATTPPMSTYITALMAGPYHVVRSEHDGIELGLWCRQTLAPYLDAEELFEVTRQGFDWYHAHLGTRYAFGKYDQLFVPELDVSAMENAGCVTFSEDHLFRGAVTDVARERRAETLLHELAHMWFGNLVTMHWWDDVWLNETLATYAAGLCQAGATRWTRAWTTFANTEKSRALDSDQLPSTHPVAADVADVQAAEAIFDGITYMKGASVLRQLGERIEEATLMAGLRDYLDRHAFGNATRADLVAALERSAASDLGSWADSWLGTAGVNTLRLERGIDSRGLVSAGEIVQSAPTQVAASNTLRPHRVAVSRYDPGAGDRLRRTGRFTVDVAGARTAIAQLAEPTPSALVLLDDGDLGYAKLRLDPASLAALRTHGVASLDSSLARARCWSILWDMTRDAELAAREYVAIVLEEAGREPEIGILQSLLARALSALELYTDPQWAPTGYSLLADAAMAALPTPPGGGLAQLAWLHALLGSARSAEHHAFLADLLDHTQTIDGLAIDVEVRWAIVGALAAADVADPQMIATEAERDPSAHGQWRAATARAKRPSAAAKTQAWHLAVEDGTVSNGLRRAVIAGFDGGGTAQLLTPYVARYCTEIVPTWRRLGGKPARHVAAELFPAWGASISAQTLTAVNELLAGTELPAGLRSVVLDGRARLVRALTARACDARCGGFAEPAG